MDRYGNKDYSKGVFRTDKDGRNYHVDTYGNTEHRKGHYQAADKNRVAVRVDPNGVKQWREGSFVTEKSKR